MKKIILSVLIIAIAVIVFSHNSLAERGCCSWHGGVCGCDSSVGRQLCCDGSLSPSCGCAYNPPKPKVVTQPTPTKTVTTQSTNSEPDYKKMYESSKSDLETCKNDSSKKDNTISENNKQITKLKNDATNSSDWNYILGFLLIIAIVKILYKPKNT